MWSLKSSNAVTGQPAPPLADGDQVIAGKEMHRSVRVRAVVNNPVQQVQDKPVLDSPRQLLFQYGPVDGREVAPDIQFQHIGVVAGELLVAVHRPVHTLVLAAGIAVGNKTLVQQGFEHVHDGMVHHTVPERRHGDYPGLALVHGKLAIRAGRIRAGRQFLLQCTQVLLQVQAEARHVRPPALAFAGLAIRCIQVVQGHHLIPDAPDAMHGLNCPLRLLPGAELCADVNQQLAAVKIAFLRDNPQFKRQAPQVPYRGQAAVGGVELGLLVPAVSRVHAVLQHRQQAGLQALAQGEAPGAGEGVQQRYQPFQQFVAIVDDLGQVCINGLHG